MSSMRFGSGGDESGSMTTRRRQLQSGAPTTHSFAPTSSPAFVSTASPSLPTPPPTLVPTDATAPTLPEVTELHAFEASGATLLAITTILALILSALFKRRGGRFRRYVPSSLLVLIVGGFAGLASRLVLGTERVAEQLPALFDAETFFFVLLPPIVFHAGIAVEKVRFFANLDGIVLYAFLGTIISTLAVGAIVYGAAAAGWISIDRETPLQAFLFGALISSVDPLAALSVLNDDVDPDLSTLIFGEAVLNDATAISLFQVFLHEYLRRTSDNLGSSTSQRGEPSADFSAADVFLAILRFFLVASGSLVVGMLAGACIVFVVQRTNWPITLRLQLMSFGALLSYALAEVLSLSGVFAVFTTGVVLSLRLVEAQREAVLPTFELFAQTAETVVYINLGIDFMTTRHVWDFPFILVAVFACLVARALNVFPLSGLANRAFRRNSPGRVISRAAQLVIFFAGFRGAVCYALSLQLPSKHPGVAVLQSTTLAVVVFSTVVLGVLSYPVTKAAGLVVERHQGDLTPLVEEGVGEEDSVLQAAGHYMRQATPIHLSNRTDLLRESRTEPLVPSNESVLERDDELARTPTSLPFGKPDAETNI